MRLPAAIKSGIPVRYWQEHGPLVGSVAEIPIIGHIFKRLDASYNPANVNFELLLHALEHLDPFVFAKTSHDIDDEYRPVLYAFTRMKRRSEFLQDIGFLSDLRRSVVNRILEIFLDRESSLGPDPARATRGLISRLEEHFTISVFTLNYDDIIDRTREMWFDGFEDPIGGGPQDAGRRAWRFDALRFARWREQTIPVLAHLHGSVRYGHFANATFHQHDVGALVKFDNTRDAFNSLVGVAQGDQVSGGRIVSSSSIISGLSKVEKLMSSPSPYGYYYMALIAALAHSSRLLIIGYGGGDAHMNTWLKEFTRSHRGNHKAVYVGKLSAGTAFERTPARSLVSLLAARADVESVSDEPLKGDHFRTFGSLGIVASGFPMRDVTLDKAIQFLRP